MLPPEQMRQQIARSADDAEREQLLPLTTLEIDVTDKRGNRYKGSFVYKVPTLGAQIEIGRLKAAYLPQGAESDLAAKLLTEQICYLEVTLQQPRPEWYRPFELYDAAPVSALYAEAIKYERRFHGADPVVRADPQSHTETPDDDGGGDVVSATAPRAQVRDPAKRRTTVIAHGSGGD